MKRKYILQLPTSASILYDNANCRISNTCKRTALPPNPTAADASVTQWITRGNKTMLLQSKKSTLHFGTNANIDIVSSQAFKSEDGFGYTLTGGSVYQFIQPSTKIASAGMFNAWG